MKHRIAVDLWFALIVSYLGFFTFGQGNLISGTWLLIFGVLWRMHAAKWHARKK
jgi:hypothetical protein